MFVIIKNILALTVIVIGALIYVTGEKNPIPTPAPALVSMEEKVLPSEGVILPVRWGDLGKQLVAAGAIDREKFEQLYSSRGGLSVEMKAMLYGGDNGNIKITTNNSGTILNFLWALGL